MENKLTFKQEKWDDGFYYEYYVDEQSRKQGVVKIYYIDSSTGERTNKIHGIMNYVNGVPVGNILSFDENGFCTLMCSCNDVGKLHGRYYSNNYKNKLSFERIFNNGIELDRPMLLNNKITYSLNLKHLKI